MVRRGGATAASIIAATLVITPARAIAPGDQYVAFNALDTVITDQRTKLAWERRPADTTVSQSGAGSYCAALRLQSKSDWRLPTYKELLTIVDEELWQRLENGVVVDKAADYDAFTEVQSQLYWSSSIAPSGEGWAVDFSSGTSYKVSGLNTNRVRCVRLVP